MNHGIKISISEADFKSKPAADQNWILFQAIQKIDEYGCSWAAVKYKENFWKKLAVIGSGIGAGFGFAIMVGKMFGCL